MWMMSVLSSSPRLLDGLDDAADLVIRVLDRCGKDFHPPGTDLFIQLAKRIPWRNGRRHGREFGAGRNDPEFYLSRQDSLPEFVIAVVELALVFFDELVGTPIGALCPFGA